MQSEDRWVIDIDWLEANDRSFSVMVSNYLCTKCRKKLKIDQSESQPSDILKSIKSCCSKDEEFLSPMLPLQESVFRVLLANGNKGLTLQEINQELGNRRGIEIYHTSPEFLTRLLENDRHYGFKMMQM